ncbi:MAG: energy transducer TonB [Alteromonadaceae bacterium]|nr:energy transducer TonB [Alteromonadaceae bacterium]
MSIPGLLLSCLLHVAVVWAVWQGGWMTPAAELSPEMPEQVVVALLQPVAANTKVQPETSPVAQVPDEAPPVSAEPPTPEKKVAPEPEEPPAVADTVPAPEPETRTPVDVERPAVKPEEEPVAPVEPSPTRTPEPAGPEPRVEKKKQVASTARKPVAPVARPEVPARPSYAQRLSQRVNHHKSYPRRARERGLSGEVRFTVNVGGKGEMRAFHWQEGHRAFRSSTLQAVRRALPYPPDPGLAPVSVQIRMIYSLQDRM